MKLSHNEFWAVLRESAGIYARASRIAKREYGVDITRIAIRDRALKDPEQLDDIREESVDIAEEGLHALMRSKNEPIRLKAVERFLKSKGKSRGWGDKQELDITGNMNMNFVVEFVDPDEDFE